jgi:hypothetical protein
VLPAAFAALLLLHALSFPSPSSILEPSQKQFPFRITIDPARSQIPPLLITPHFDNGFGAVFFLLYASGCHAT